MNIFTYGTLMIPTVMYTVTNRHFRSQKAILRGYARFTVRAQSFPGIISVPDAITKGIIYLDVDEPSLQQLDAFEGDLYRRTPIRVEIQEDKMLPAEAYVIKRKYRGYLSSKKWDVDDFSQNALESFLETRQGLR
jgi:gamma-glutamylcyclotransferase (GGCT)/AIG2-like uncharacterized protein YtfP